MTGNLDWVVTRGGRKASLWWQLQNKIRWGYIRGWIASFVVGPIANSLGVATILGELRAIKHSFDGSYVDYGVIGRRVVTTAYCEFIVDQHQTESSIIGDFKFHDSGVGVTAENSSDTAMETTDAEARASGTQTEESSVIYRSVGTISYTSTKAITEHGLFNNLTTVTLMDRTKFSAINVVSGDSIQFTYGITYTAGS